MPTACIATAHTLGSRRITRDVRPELLEEGYRKERQVTHLFNGIMWVGLVDEAEGTRRESVKMAEIGGG